MTSHNTRVERAMSGPETMMWHIDRDPWLATSGSAVSIFEGQLDADRFRVGMSPPVRGYVRSSLDAYTVDGVGRLEEQGVTDVVVGFRWPYAVGPDTQPLPDKLDLLGRYGDDVIAKVRA